MKKRTGILAEIGMFAIIITFGIVSGAMGTYSQSITTEKDVISENVTDVMPKAKTEPETEASSDIEALAGIADTVIPAEHTIASFDIISQFPELPTGCEITALTMVLNYYGYSVDKVEMAEEYLPTIEAVFYETEAGDTIGPDLNSYFVGNPADVGYICGNKVIAEAANAFLTENDGEHQAVAIAGNQASDLYAYVAQDIPVVVWVTINMEDRAETSGWYLEDGSYVEWSENDHGAVLIGYDENTVTIADPIYDIVTCSKEQFEKIYAERGSQSVILL